MNDTQVLTFPCQETADTYGRAESTDFCYEEAMDMDFEQVKKIVVDTLGCDEDKVTESASLTDDLEADSLDLVELHMAFEDALGVKIPDETLAKMKTIGDICDYLKTVQKDGAAKA